VKKVLMINFRKHNEMARTKMRSGLNRLKDSHHICYRIQEQNTFSF